jgi:hypothetical protein
VTDFRRQAIREMRRMHNRIRFSAENPAIVKLLDYLIRLYEMEMEETKCKPLTRQQ